jgi:hypothetical protein
MPGEQDAAGSFDEWVRQYGDSLSRSASMDVCHDVKSNPCVLVLTLLSASIAVGMVAVTALAAGTGGEGTPYEQWRFERVQIYEYDFPYNFPDGFEYERPE